MTSGRHVVTEVSIGVHCLLPEFILLYCHLNLFFRQIKVGDLEFNFCRPCTICGHRNQRAQMDAMTGTKESKNVENIHFPKSLASASLPGKYYVDV